MTAVRFSRRAARAVTLAIAGCVAGGGAAVLAQSPSLVPEVSAPPALAAEVEAIIGQAESLRELTRVRPVDWKLADRDTALAQQLERESSDPEVMDRLRQDERILIRLGLLPEGTDLLQLTVDTLQDQVAGYYDSETRSLTVLDEDGELDLASRITLAHEAGHAIVDQHWDLEAMQDAIPLVEGDRVAAFQALAEGDATLLMTLWSARHAASDLVGMDGAGLPGQDSLDGLPQVIQRQLLYPYLDGLAFLMQAWGPGGWQDVNAIWDAPPVSSEQIMHPEKYPDETPVEVALPDVAALLGDGWSQTGETVMGELNIGVLVADGADWDPASFSLGGVRMPGWEAAAGWAGDRLVTVDGPDDAWALVWQTAWDTEVDRTEFIEAATRALADLPGVVSVSAEDVTSTGVDAGAGAAAGLPAPAVLVIASDAATHELVAAALGVEAVPAGG